MSRASSLSLSWRVFVTFTNALRCLPYPDQLDADRLVIPIL
jgi:hypothetical protein